MTELLTSGQIADLWVRKCEKHKVEDIRPLFCAGLSTVNATATVESYDGPVMPDGYGTNATSKVKLQFFVAPYSYHHGDDLHPECQLVKLEVDNTTPHLTEQQAIELFDKELQPVIAWVKSLPVNR